MGFAQREEAERSWTGGWIAPCRYTVARLCEEGWPIEGGGEKERRSTYPCFHTGGTSDARYGASRPARSRRAPYTPMRRVNCPARYRAVRRGTLYARERQIVYTVVPYRGGRIVRPGVAPYVQPVAYQCARGRTSLANRRRGSLSLSYSPSFFFLFSSSIPLHHLFSSEKLLTPRSRSRSFHLAFVRRRREKESLRKFSLVRTISRDREVFSDFSYSSCRSPEWMCFESCENSKCIFQIRINFLHLCNFNF